MKLTILSLWLYVLSSLAAPTSTDELQDPPHSHNVTMHIKHGADKVGELTLGLFGTVVPKTVENFVQLSTGENGYGYVNSTFHRIIDHFMIQGGDIDGSGGHSIYGKKFNDENFIIKHDRPGRLSMANAGPNTQGSQFFITTVVTSHLDGHHVVFGQLLDGFEFLDYLQKVEGDKRSSKPIEDVVITKMEVTKLPVDYNENADYFDELTAQSHGGGWFWLLVFSLLALGLYYSVRARNKTLAVLKKNIVATSRSE